MLIKEREKSLEGISVIQQAVEAKDVQALLSCLHVYRGLPDPQTAATTGIVRLATLSTGDCFTSLMLGPTHTCPGDDLSMVWLHIGRV